MARRQSVSERVRRFWADVGATAAAPSNIVAAVSGGPDSVALLNLLIETRPGRIVVAHFNHRLRGSESDADEDFVGQLVERLNPASGGRLSLHVGRAPRGPAGMSEAAARRTRYAWLLECAKSEGITWIATGHTADDVAETVLFNLIRGTGWRGLSGIPAQRALGRDARLVRPLLKVTRREVFEYLDERRQDFREDASNSDLRFARNRIRHELLPLLERRFNPRVREALGRLAVLAGETDSVVTRLAAGLLRWCENPRAGERLVFDGARLRARTEFELRILWRHVWEREGWPRRELGREQLDRLVALCRAEFSAVDLPGGIQARRRGHVIQVGPRAPSLRRDETS